MFDNFSKDDELWDLVKKGNKLAFTLLYRRYVQLVFSEVTKRIDNTTDAQDITQEIFLSLWEKRGSIEIESRLYSFLYGIIQNKIFNYFRRKKISAKHLDAWDKITGDIPVPASAYTGTAILSKMELSITEEQNKLPDRMKTVYELRYIKKMSVDYISQNLNISPNTVRNQLKEVRRRFSLAIKKEFCLLAVAPEVYQIVNCIFLNSQI